MVDLTGLLTGATAGGTWAEGDCAGTNTNPQAIDISSPTNVDFVGAVAGNYTFAYTITITSGTCAGTYCSEVTVVVDDAPSAGTGSSITICNT